MRKIAIAIAMVMVCLFLSTCLCYAQEQYPVSSSTINETIQLKKYMDHYAKDAFKDSFKLGARQREDFQKILDYVIIVSGKLNALISILQTGNYQSGNEQVDGLTTQEMIKFIDFVIQRTDMMDEVLEKRSQHASEAMMIHHVERAKEFIRQARGLLRQFQGELNQF